MHSVKVIKLMQFKFRIVLLLFILSLVGCSFMPDELKTVEQLIETNPDSALHILQSLSPEKYKSGENRALYGLLKIEALDKKKLPLYPDSLLDFSIAYFQEHKNPLRLASCYLYKGRIYKYDFQYENAMSLYLKALDVLDGIDDFLLLGRIKTDIADIFLYQSEFTKAQQKYLEAFDCYKKAKSYYFANYSLIYVGITLTHAKSFKKANYYFQKVYTTSSDSLIKGFALQNAGINYYNSKQLDSALYYLKKSVPYPYIKTNKAIRYYYIADVYFDLNKFDSAYFYAKNSFNYQPDKITQRECYRILVNVYNEKGDIPNLKKSMIGYQNCIDSIRKIDAQTKGSYIETMSNTKKEVVKTKNKLWYLLLCIFFIIGAFVIIYIKKHKKNKLDKQQDEAIRLQQREDLIKDMILKRRESLQRRINKKIVEQEQEWKKSGSAERKLIIQKMYNELLNINNTVAFYKEMDTVLNNLVSKLHTQYPDLSEIEIQWCCLNMLEISNQDILMLLDYNLDGMKKMRQRFAKKVNITYVSKINEFLYSLIIE